MILGIFVILVGVVLLLKNIGLIFLPASFWSLFYPVVLIVIGIYVLIGAEKGKKYFEWGKRKLFNNGDGKN